VMVIVPLFWQLPEESLTTVTVQWNVPALP
jgi:hypothetical protein